MGAGVWLLDLTIGGRVFRYATRAVEVESLTLGTVRYRAGLGDFEATLDGLTESQGVEIVDRSKDWARIAAAAEGLDRQPAVLRFWRGDELLENAIPLVDGVVSAPEYGDPVQPGRLALSVTIRKSDVQFPDAQAVVDAATFTNTANVLVIDDGIVGAVYPYVIGYPGYRGPDQDPVPAVPALLVHYNALTGSLGSHLMVSAGVTDALEQAGDITLWDSDETDGAILDFANQTEPVESGTDLLGRAYSLVKFTTGNPIKPFTGHRYYTSWSPASGGGLLRPKRDAPIRELTDFLIWALANSGRPVDVEAQETQRDLLPYLVDGYINVRAPLLDQLEQNVVPLFPLVRVTGPRGIWYRAVNFAARRTDAVAHLDADLGRVRRATPIRTAEDQLANLFTLDYQASPQTGGYYGRRVLGPAQGELGTDEPLNIHEPEFDARIVGAPLCAASAAKYGTIERPAVQTQLVWDDGTASRIVQYWAIRDCFPRRFVSYTGPDLWRFSRGDVVTITDSGVALDRAVALVDSVTLSSQRLQTVALEVLDATFRSRA